MPVLQCAPEQFQFFVSLGFFEIGTMARVVHFTAAGFKPQLIEVAPDGEEQESKRSHIIDEEVKTLNQISSSLLFRTRT
jgi:hypothetical protein